MGCNDKFWIENIKNLFCSCNIIPFSSMTLEEQMNALTRLVFLIFLILLFLESKYDIIFLLISLIFIIIIYYIKKRMSNSNATIENYSCSPAPKFNKDMFKDDTPMGNKQYNQRPLLTNPNTEFLFCDTYKKAQFNNPNYLSSNQKLSNEKSSLNDFKDQKKPGNPKFYENPIIPSPIADLDAWKSNNFAVHSNINDSTNIDISRSGYQVQTCCGALNEMKKNIKDPGCDCKEDDIIEPFVNKNNSKPGGCMSCGYPNNIPQPQETPINKMTDVDNQGIPIPRFYRGKGNCQECCTQKTDCECKDCNKDVLYMEKKVYPGAILKPSGYDPEQLLDHNIPSNLPVGDCELNNNLNCYNKMLYSGNLQPDTYTKSNIIEPINANIGISYTQQTPPITVEKDCDGKTFVYNDPKLEKIENKKREEKFKNLIDRSDIYDPRFFGYGTSYRGYIDKDLGQPRYYYDDIDAHTKGNYIIKSDIDFARFSQSSGPYEPLDGTEESNMRRMANDAFLDSTLEFRNSLQESLMRKSTQREWQLKKYPKHTNFRTN